MAIKTNNALSAFGKKAATTSTKVYSKLPDPDGTISKMVDQRVDCASTEKAASGTKKQIDGVLKNYGLDTWVDNNEDKDLTEDTFQADGKSGSVKVIFTSRYYDLTIDREDPKSAQRLSEIQSLLGLSYGRFVTEKFKLDVDGSAIPADQQEDFLGELAELLEKHGSNPAEAVQVKEVLAISKKFHGERHSILSQEENKHFHDLWSCVVAVK